MYEVCVNRKQDDTKRPSGVREERGREEKQYKKITYLPGTQQLKIESNTIAKLPLQMLNTTRLEAVGALALVANRAKTKILL